MRGDSSHMWKDTMPTMRLLKPALLAAAIATVAPLAAQAGDVNIGLTITGEITPGVYGRVDLTNRPAPPPVVYAQPVIVERTVEAERVAPIYLHVPPDHARNWHKYCHEYHACNRRVYFVKSREYEPGYRAEKEHLRQEEHHERAHERYEEHQERHDRDHDEHRDHDHHD